MYRFFLIELPCGHFGWVAEFVTRYPYPSCIECFASKTRPVPIWARYSVGGPAPGLRIQFATESP